MQNQNVASYTVINPAGATVVLSGRGVYLGYKVLGNAGALTMDIYDNTAASGQLLEPAAISVAAAAEKVYGTGVEVKNGITVNVSGDPTDGLIMILFAK